jgi:hypothetical protein
MQLLLYLACYCLLLFMKKIFTLFFLLSASGLYAQKLEKLTVEKIMSDPKWMGTSPENIRWTTVEKYTLTGTLKTATVA